MDRILPWYLNGKHSSWISLFFGWIMMVVLNAVTLAAYVVGPLAAGYTAWKYLS